VLLFEIRAELSAWEGLSPIFTLPGAYLQDPYILYAIDSKQGFVCIVNNHLRIFQGNFQGMPSNLNFDGSFN
jgi:hypothetical protein